MSIDHSSYTNFTLAISLFGHMLVSNAFPLSMSNQSMFFSMEAGSGSSKKLLGLARPGKGGGCFPGILQ